MVVGETWRSRGIGTALMKLLLEYAQGQGIRGIRAEVLPGNQGMVRLHRTLGHDVRWDATSKLYEIRHLFTDTSVPGTQPHDVAPDRREPQAA